MKPPKSTIKIFDDIIPKELSTKLSAFVKKPIWQYGWRSNIHNSSYFFWHSHFAGGDTGSDSDCTALLLSSIEMEPIYELWIKIANLYPSPHKLLRAYANGHTYGTEGYVHQDSNQEDQLSSVYFSHDEWNPDWGAELQFYDENGDILMSVTPRPGRVVIFPGYIPHRATSLSRMCPLLRVSIVFKFIPYPLPLQ